MDYDTDKVDDMALALLFLTLHDGCRAWKGLDWEIMDRLHEKGMILDPVGKQSPSCSPKKVSNAAAISSCNTLGRMMGKYNH
jgi:Domain of unknown function (DUF6429)